MKKAKKSASDADIYRSTVIWTPMSSRRREGTLASLKKNQTINFLSANNNNNNNNNGTNTDSTTNFMYNERRIPLNSSQTASIFTSSNRLSLESFQMSEEIFKMKQQIEKSKSYKERHQPQFLRNMSSSSSSLRSTKKNLPRSSSLNRNRKTYTNLPTVKQNNNNNNNNNKSNKTYSTVSSQNSAGTKKKKQNAQDLWKMQSVPDNRNYARPEILNVCSADEVIKCMLCAKEIKSRQRKYHEEFLCEERLVQCRNPGCSKMMPFSKRDGHEKKTCKFAKIQIKFIEENKKSGGSSGVVLCSLNCGAAIPRKDVGRHQTLICPKRIVPCPYAPSCNKTFKHELLEEHVKTCKFGIKQKAMAESSKKRRCIPVKCSPHHKFGCGKMLLLKDMARHDKYECPNRLVQCRNIGCKEMIRMNVRQFHEDRFCEVKKARDELLSWGEEIIDCPFGCGAELTAREVVEHKKEKCPNRIIKCKIAGCNQEYYATYQERHETLWEKIKDPTTGADYYFNTITEETSWEVEGCPMLRKRHMYLKRYEKHAKIVQCPLRCGEEYKDTLSALRRHQKTCGRFPIPCPVLGCKARVLREELQLHLDEWCPIMRKRDKDATKAIAKRGFQKCTQCDILLPKQDLNFHMKAWCSEKQFKCQKPGCNMFISHKTSVTHALTECQYWKDWDERIQAARKKQKNPLDMG